MVDQEILRQVLPMIEELALEAQVEFIEDTILQKKSRTIKGGNHGRQQVGLKGKHLGKAKWYSREKVDGNFPHLNERNQRTIETVVISMIMLDLSAGN